MSIRNLMSADEYKKMVAMKPRPGRRQSKVNSRMNKTEARYAQYLENLKYAGEICSYKFEAVKLRLADSTFYTCDFMVVRENEWTQGDTAIEFHEVKGHWEDDARVKIKVASEIFTEFLFVAVKPDKAGWKYECFA